MLPDFERRTALGAGETEPSYSHYWTFYDEVSRRALLDWLPERSARILDLSRGGVRHAMTAKRRGHEVFRRIDRDEADRDEADRDLARDEPGGEDIRRIIAEPLSMDWVADDCLDGVVAESGVLSRHLAAENALRSIHRMLRPNGRLLLCVDSLVLGLARLAEQSKWAELADVPSADVVLVPHEDGSISRSFWPEQLELDLMESGFDVEWVRPRTVLSHDAVERALAQDAATLETLVQTELELSREREGESIGIHLVASARRRNGRG